MVGTGSSLSDAFPVGFWSFRILSPKGDHMNCRPDLTPSQAADDVRVKGGGQNVEISNAAD